MFATSVEIADLIYILTLPFLGYLLSLLLVGWVLLHKKRNPASTTAWILIIVLVPLMGGLLFLVFGVNRVNRRTARKQRASRAISRHTPQLSQYQLIPGEGLTSEQRQLMRLANRVDSTFPTIGNAIEIMPDTHRTLESMERAIGAAKESIHLEYYIWKPDETGTRLRDMLVEKANAGVSVRFLYDRLGSILLNKKWLNTMRDAGIRVASFLPGMTFRERWSFNLRNHRKIIIVDGRVGFTGGMNIGDEYLGKNPRLGFWRDTHLKILGPAVLQLQQVFVEDWYYATGEELVEPTYFPRPEDTGRISAQVIAGGPDDEFDEFHALMFAAINEARNRITLTTSYFVPPVALATALETAALRGVNVRLMIPGKSAHQWTVVAGRSYYEPLLAAGAEIYEYHEGLLHAKTLTVDGEWSLVGSPNFDNRSLVLNFEVGLAIYERRLALLLEEHFAADVERARRIDQEEWLKRSRWTVVKENACRLFAPVL